MKSHKRFYSVKEAARILDVSTNTVYSYLEKGTVRAKRLGRGKFKIHASDLAPYLAPAKEDMKPFFNFNFNKGVLDGFLGRDAGYEVKGNFIFWRVYLAYLMLATGAIHLFWHFNLFLSLPLIIGGAATLYIAENWEEHQALSFWINIFDLLALISASILAFFGGEIYMLIFLGSTAVCVFIQTIIGINKLSREGSLVSEFTASIIIGSVFLGTFSLLKPGFLPMEFMQNFVSENKVSFLLLLILVTVPAVYIQWVLFRSRLRERSHLELFVFPVYGIGSLIAASLYSNLGIWDMAYACFFYGFLAFVVIWFRKAGTISAYRKNGLLLTFGWICIAIIVGIFSMFWIQERLKISVSGGMRIKVDAVVDDINEEFIVSESAVPSVVNSSNLRQVLASRDKSGAEEFTKTLYDKLSNVNRVLVYDDGGIAIGVYPRSSITEGTDFSSRDYFQTAKSTTKPYLGNVFTSVVGTQTVIYAVPVFSGAKFLGEVGIAYNLPVLSQKFQTSSPSGRVFAYDRVGNYAINVDSDQLGKKVSPEILDNSDKDQFETDTTLFSCLNAGVPEWRVCKGASISDTTQVLYITNAVIIVFLFVNAAQSLRAGFSLSEKNKEHV